MSTVVTYTSNASWVCPSGVSSIQIECWGPGANGLPSSNSNTGARGGGGGAYAKVNSFSVTPGNSYSIVVGTGGSTTQTTFNSTTCVADYGNSFQGGQSSNCTGDTKVSGGNGGTGYSFDGGGGGGGGCAGSNGNNAVDSLGVNGGSGGNGGGNGGKGGNWQNNGNAASSPGGGGGGGGGGVFTDSWHNTTGGAGKDGQVTLTFTAASQAVNMIVLG
jgi:hypothetical protein